MKLAKKLVMLVLVVVLAGPILGCGVGTTMQENIQAGGRVANYDALMLADDLRLFWQLDRPVRTSRWIIRG